MSLCVIQQFLTITACLCLITRIHKWMMTFYYKSRRLRYEPCLCPDMCSNACASRLKSCLCVCHHCKNSAVRMADQWSVTVAKCFITQRVRFISLASNIGSRSPVHLHYTRVHLSHLGRCVSNKSGRHWQPWRLIISTFSSLCLFAISAAHFTVQFLQADAYRPFDAGKDRINVQISSPYISSVQCEVTWSCSKPVTSDWHVVTHSRSFSYIRLNKIPIPQTIQT